MRPTRWLPAMAMVMVLGGCVLAGGHLETPKLSVVSLQQAGGDLVRQQLTVRLLVQNPNDRELPVRGLTVAMDLGGEQFADGVSAREFTVPAHGEAEFDMLMHADALGLVTKLLKQRASGGKTAEYRIKGKVSTRLGMIRSIPFEETGTIPLDR